MARRLLLGPKTILPCTPPPWGTLTAVKAATGEIGAAVPLGQFPGTEKIPDAALGLDRARRPDRHGRRTVFTAGTLEAAIYAFDVQTGSNCGRGRCPRAHGRRQ